MPKIRTQRTKRPPEGFDDIEPTLREFDKKMRDGKYRFSHVDLTDIDKRKIINLNVCFSLSSGKRISRRKT